MANRLLIIVVLLPIAVVLIALAVANRAPVAFTLDPFNPGNPALTVQLPLFVLLFLALVLGLVIGGTATWIRQGRYRKAARQWNREPARTAQSARNGTGSTALAKPGA
jgi:uncharacterized integral membrane protein